MIFIRSLIFNIIAYSTLALGCTVTSVVGLFNRKATVKMWNYGFMPFILWCLKIIVGLQIEIRGKEYMKQEGVLYASKHESALETYCLSSYITKLVFVLKKELTYIPLFGWAQYFYGMIPVDRPAGGAAMKNMLKEAKDRIKNGRPIIIFPEGTRVKPGTVKGYKPGLLFIAQNLNVPVVPVALNTGFFWAKASFMRYPGKVIIEFMEPMPANLDKKEFMSELEKRIEAKCRELNEETVKNYPYTRNMLG
ncbi:MAG: lysophospholipid acyltransferase family protein [Alphaproteobacteria bacterium]